jgi:polyisoprenoid-binding protein YceI
MKATKILLLISVWALALQFSVLQAQTFGVKSYQLKVSGTSSLHEWESTAEKLDAKGSFVVTNNTLTDIKEVIVRIPVTAIKSTKGKMMDNKTYEAFKHEKNPNIVFTLTGKTINTASQSINVTGNLTMAGVTKSIDMNVKYKLLPGGELQVTGSKKLVMTQFKMDPPTAMMGTIKVGDEVTVTFDVVLSQGAMVKTQY